MELRKSYSVLVFWLVIVGIIVYVIAHNIIERNEVKKNPYETIATITRIEKCSKRGRCVYYKYSYGKKEYEGRSRTDFIFTRWCKDKNECIGLKFKIIINKDNPEQQLVNWDKVFDDKNFINLP